MPIRFPRMHVAQSVVNRILNVADELVAQRAPAVPEPHPAPEPADPTIPGAELDLALREPLAPMPPIDEGNPADPSANAAEATLSGGRPLQGLLDPISGA